MDYSSYSPEGVNTEQQVSSERKSEKKKVKLFHKAQKIKTTTMLFYIITGTVAIVLYIGNILSVREQMRTNIELKEKLTSERSKTESLKSQVDQLENVERIQKIAKEDLGLAYPKKPPMTIQVRKKDIEKVTPSN